MNYADYDNENWIQVMTQVRCQAGVQIRHQVFDKYAVIYNIKPLTGATNE